MKKIAHLTILFTIPLFFLFQSCQTVRLISEYDEITDKSLTNLQEKVTKYFVGVERAFDDCAKEIKKDCQEAQYDNFKSFFDGAKIDLSTLEIRANAIEKNEIVKGQIALLKTNLSNLEKAHQEGYASKKSISPTKNSFNTSFTAILKLQLALKRGEIQKKNKQ